jgi:hypothetical protein
MGNCGQRVADLHRVGKPARQHYVVDCGRLRTDCFHFQKRVRERRGCCETGSHRWGWYERGVGLDWHGRNLRRRDCGEQLVVDVGEGARSASKGTAFRKAAMAAVAA